MRASSLRAAVAIRAGAALVLAALLMVVGLVDPPKAKGATFVVNTTSDFNDGICNATHCSLREAINAANAAGGPDTISFAIGGGGIQTITFLSLPTITGPLTLDGTTQTGYSGTPVIELRGSAMSALGPTATNTVHISGLSLTNFEIALQLDVGSNGSTVTGNWVGIRSNNTLSANASGIHIRSDNNTVGGTSVSLRNVIAAHYDDAILIDDADNTTIIGNYIGVKPDGVTASGGGVGIRIQGTSANTQVGGTVAATRNVIGGQTSPFSPAAGIYGTTAIVEGNFIGIGADGFTSISSHTGVQLQGGRIGGSTGASRNVIGSNISWGVVVQGDVEIRNNYIGVAADGVTARGNGGGAYTTQDAGIFVLFGSATITGNLIAYTAGVGVRTPSYSGDYPYLEKNSIMFNDGLGIDLQDDGVTTTAVTVGTAVTNPAVTSITGLVSYPGPVPLLLDFYASSACDSSGRGEGGRWIGETIVNVPFPPGTTNFNFQTPLVVSPGEVVTATSTLGGDTSEFSNCVTVPPCGGASSDCDGFADVAATSHLGPVNTNAAVDNCPGVTNQIQLNTGDGNFIDHSPPYMSTVDDKTWPNSDPSGDDCDADKDNDGLDDNVEIGLPFAPCPSASGPTNPYLRDSDGDRFLDGVECTLGTDPASAASKPAVTACGPTGDADGDKLTDRVETCFYGTDPNNTDTDGDRTLDGAKDGCEAASLNGDRIVNVADMGMLASAISNVTFRVVSVDINKDGAWNPADQGLLASFISPGGQCP